MIDRTHLAAWLVAPLVAASSLAALASAPRDEEKSKSKPAPAASPAAPAADKESRRKMSNPDEPASDALPKTEREWREKLTPMQYHVMREKGTERAFSGKYWNHRGDGVYQCAGCGAPLFDSTSKFDSECGWPSFDKALSKGKGIREEADFSLFMTRTEVICKKCGAHLGHVFNDGPTATGLRYCINSASIDFQKRKPAKAESEEAPKP